MILQVLRIFIVIMYFIKYLIFYYETYNHILVL